MYLSLPFFIIGPCLITRPLLVVEPPCIVVVFGVFPTHTGANAEGYPRVSHPNPFSVIRFPSTHQVRLRVLFENQERREATRRCAALSGGPDTAALLFLFQALYRCRGWRVSPSPFFFQNNVPAPLLIQNSRYRSHSCVLTTSWTIHTLYCAFST